VSRRERFEDATVAEGLELSDRPLTLAVSVAPGSEDVRAELAVVVGDPWQHCGVGRMLVARLAALARSRGITAFEVSC
jgi:hypothetical protein